LPSQKASYPSSPGLPHRTCGLCRRAHWLCLSTPIPFPHGLKNRNPPRHPCSSVVYIIFVPWFSLPSWNFSFIT
jgi:hypothetical protein